ncbi:hypothetical protein VHEMI06980 [[Torrubiella] hemipterigena]|uniref:C2 NT-type domain-containing protein n=1 Tax=[Torrubiella] hemipterigena TaxID=1531966 RepID=A0A0A1TM40_9HYPO|nr:hypothetical protein VHEMI06980 [[Torrubiella] hemipterigena]
MNILSVGKGHRKPKFELHLKIYDLNNVPLVSGNSYIKWHLSHSMHAEHRGRTSKCSVANHRVEYAYTKVIQSVRISLDKSNVLSECPIELEIVQEFPGAEKMTLGFVRLNLSEYVEESESFARDSFSSPTRVRHGSSSGISPVSSAPRSSTDTRDPEDGIVRRYLMQDSKVNSTLKIGILMVQVDGERSYIAPALKTAPVFGGIAGFMAPEQLEDDTGPLPVMSKNRETAEVQDLYRRTLAASWSRQPAELPADECIEDIFSGGNGWKTKRDHSSSTADTEDDDAIDGGYNNGTLRPSDIRRIGIRSHQRTNSASSDKSVSTVTGRRHRHHNTSSPRKNGSRHARGDSRDDDLAGRSSRSGSIASLAPTLGSSSGNERGGRTESGYKHPRELDEMEIRDDLVAWKLPGQGLVT